jgi:hypothetical protein
MSRNQERVLTDQQISSIKEQLTIHLRDNAEYMADAIMNLYLSDNKDDEAMFIEWMHDFVNQAEDGKLLSIDQINNILNQDSHDNA